MAAFDDQSIGVGHIANIGKVPFAFEIADFQDGLCLLQGNFHDLSGKGRCDEMGGLAGADVIAGSGRHDVHSVTMGVQQSRLISGDF